jgi:hypothetical protein
MPLWKNSDTHEKVEDINESLASSVCQNHEKLNENI